MIDTTVAAAVARTRLFTSPSRNRASSAAWKFASVQFAGTGASPAAFVSAWRTSATSGTPTNSTSSPPITSVTSHRPRPRPAEPAAAPVRDADRPASSASAAPTTATASTTSVSARVIARTNATGEADSAKSW